jgi:hypothetical protein
VEFSRELRGDVLAGDIPVTFRLWRRPKVKYGGRNRVGEGQIEVDSVELVPFSSIDDTDVRRAGEPANRTSNHSEDGPHMLGPSAITLSSTGSSSMWPDKSREHSHGSEGKL